ncbi:MAG: hypothetical protein V1663_00490 [archaeon]
MNKNLLFNWYENPDNILVLLEQKASKDLFLMLKQRYKSNKNISKMVGIDSKTLFYINQNKLIRLKTLKKILNNLKLDYNLYNQNIKGFGGVKDYLDLKFPINLNSINTPILIAAFMSDGHNEDQHPHYANTGFLGDKIINSAKSFIINIPYEFRNEHVRFHPILGRILLKLGVPYGCKSRINPDVPKTIFSKREWMKQYLIQVFDDEGHAATKISRKIVLGRSVILINFPENFSRSMEFSEKIYFNNLPENIKNIVLKNPPKLLVSEQNILNKFGIRSSLRCRSICKYQTRVSSEWVVEISGKENIRNFNNKIGFSDPQKIEKMNFYLNI